MKYLKKFEGAYLDNLDRKSKEYEKYKDKYVILETANAKDIFICKFLKISLNGYFANLIGYTFNSEHDNEWRTFIVEALHLDRFNILKVFDTFEEAEKEYNDMEEIKKYNL